MSLRPTSSLQKGGQKRGNGVYMGIRLRKGRWVSEIRVSKTPTRIWLGSHPSAEKAARAYDAALYCLKGEDGKFNFPNNRRPDLNNKPIGSLSDDEIRCIAQKFSSLEEESVDTPALSPPRELSPRREVPQLVESSVLPNWEMRNQFCANKVDVSEELYKPTFATEEVPYDPNFLPDGEYLAEQFMQLDQWGVFDGDWMRYLQNASP